MEHEFISDIETWGSSGQMLDVVTLENGEILLITGDALVLYDSRRDFDANVRARALSRQRK